MDDTASALGNLYGRDRVSLVEVRHCKVAEAHLPHVPSWGGVPLELRVRRYVRRSREQPSVCCQGHVAIVPVCSYTREEDKPADRPQT
jgi:hypothetical protein